MTNANTNGYRTSANAFGRNLDARLSLALGEAFEEAAMEVADWIGEHVTTEVHEMPSQTGGKFWAAEYVVNGEAVAYGFHPRDKFEALANAIRGGRAWVLREIFPQTAAILGSHDEALLRLV